MTKTVGVIKPDEVWPIVAFRERIGVGESTMAALLKDGLMYVEVHRKRYIRGQDWLDHVDREAANGDGK